MHRSMALLASVGILVVIISLGLARAAVADCATQPCQFLPYLERGGVAQGAPTPILSTPTRSATPGAISTPTRTATPTQTRTATATATATQAPSTATPTKAPTATPTQDPNQCAPEYPDFCIPPPPPDLNCADVLPHKNFTVLPPDRHHFDANNNGIGCEG